MFSLKDKVAVVTGASQGIGRDTVHALAEAGAKAREALGALMEGHDPARVAEAKRRARDKMERQLKESTFAAVAEYKHRPPPSAP